MIRLGGIDSGTCTGRVPFDVIVRVVNEEQPVGRAARNERSEGHAGAGEGHRESFFQGARSGATPKDHTLENSMKMPSCDP